ncbi:MAG: hypothetical protein ACXWQO_10475, partial [Bdellovibrionota bacterium]
NRFQARQFLLVLALVWASLFSLNLFAADPVPGAKHPVAQLVDWELAANAEMKPEALRRMALVILDRADLQDLPQKIKDAIDVPGFQGSDAATKLGILEKLSPEQLKEIAVIPAPIEYFELPEAKLHQISKQLPHEIPVEGLDRAKSYVNFEKDGVPYVRWYLHPLADAKESQIAKLFKEMFGMELAPQSGFAKFHFTSSRSVILFKGSYDDAISVKLSLKAAEGPFKDKTIHLKEYSAWSGHNAYLADVLPNGSPSMTFQREPYGLGVGSSAGEDAFLFRHLGNNPEKGYYLPAFSVFDEKVGAAIAKLNGSSDPLAYWEEHLLKPLANGMADLRANAGAEHTSAHSQNLMVELDKNMRPTGRIVLRDFDFYIDNPVYQKLNRVVKNSEGLVRDGFQPHIFSLRNGLYTLPSWMREEDYHSWIKKYFADFADHYSQVTGIPRASISTKIQKFEDYAHNNVEGDDFLRGGKSNFHLIKPNLGDDFSAHYNLWLEKRKAQIAGEPISVAVIPPIRPEPPRPVAPTVVAAPKGPIQNWEDFLQELSHSKNFDSFGGRISALIPQAKEMNLARRKELNALVANLRLSDKALLSGESKAIIEVVSALEALDPHYPIYSVGNVVKHLKDSCSIAECKSLAGNIVDRGNERDKIIQAIREGDYRELPAAVARAEELFDKPYQWVADAFAYRFTRMTDVELKLMLAKALLRISSGDAIVKKFLKDKSYNFPPDAAASLNQLLDDSPAADKSLRPHHPNFVCPAAFAHLH